MSVARAKAGGIIPPWPAETRDMIQARRAPGWYQMCIGMEAVPCPYAYQLFELGFVDKGYPLQN